MDNPKKVADAGKLVTGLVLTRTRFFSRLERPGEG